MSWPTDRMILYSSTLQRLGDLGPDEILMRKRHEEINGDHTLTIITTRVLEEGMRLLTVDGTGKWHEWVIDEPDDAHESGSMPLGTYRACWSMQYDLTRTEGGVQWASQHEGDNDPISATAALAIALTNSPMWEPGTCTVTKTAGTSLHDGQIWDYLSTLSELWGGEFDAEITVDAEGVVTRKVAWLARLGSENVTRRFDWKRDLTKIHRKPAPGPYYCRVVPRGGNEETDADGVRYSARIGIEDVTEGNVNYIEDAEMAALLRVPLPGGGYFYPTKTVIYSLKTPGDSEELYETALADLHNHTRPGVTYDATVLQLVAAGMDAQGVALGDSVHCVDHDFCAEGLRIEGRVSSIDVNELDETDCTLVIGSLGRSIVDEFRALTDSISSGTREVTRRVGAIERDSTIVHVQNLINALNEEINATDGWTYAVPGYGIVTYDVEVADPLIGEEATQVTQIKGGSLRIANTKKAGFAGINDWEWQTVIQSGHIASNLVTTVQINTGFIGNANGNFYVNLDDGLVTIGPATTVGNTTIGGMIDATDANTTSISELADELGTTVTELEAAIDEARKVATNWLYYDQAAGELVLGATDSAVRNVLTNSMLAFRIADTGQNVAWMGYNSDVRKWELHIETASIESQLRFGDFAWIKRANGNMTLKWIGG